MEEKSLTKIETGLARPPDKVIAEAKIAVNVFKGVIEQKPKQVIINGEQYLEYEDWQTLGEFYRCSAITRDAVPVEINGVQGAKARADLVNIDTGLIIGGAEAYCLRDEERWSTRPKYEWQGEGKNRKRVKLGDEVVPWFQLASMAQTRAASKAFSNRLRWVAVMAGYRGTPAEEMTGHETPSEAVQERRTVDKTSHYCPTHDVNFFKKGRMKGYAHPIEDTDDWCNEPDIVEGEVVKEVSKPSEKSQDANPGVITPPADRKVTGKTGKPPETLQELLTWASSHGKTYGPSWVAKEAGVNSSTLIKDVEKVYQDIKQVTGWTD